MDREELAKRVRWLREAIVALESRLGATVAPAPAPDFDIHGLPYIWDVIDVTKLLHGQQPVTALRESPSYVRLHTGDTGPLGGAFILGSSPGSFAGPIGHGLAQAFDPLVPTSIRYTLLDADGDPVGDPEPSGRLAVCVGRYPTITHVRTGAVKELTGFTLLRPNTDYALGIHVEGDPGKRAMRVQSVRMDAETTGGFSGPG